MLEDYFFPKPTYQESPDNENNLWFDRGAGYIPVLVALFDEASTVVHLLAIGEDQCSICRFDVSYALITESISGRSASYSSRRIRGGRPVGNSQFDLC
jgi:hypothetical protein